MILALDGSCSAGSAALVEAGRLIREESFSGGRERGGGAAAAVEGIADRRAEIFGVIVGLGPGSYSGLRSAVAAAWGVAAARGVPLQARSSLLAIGPGEYLAAGDARQEHFYFAHIREGAFVVEPVLLGARDLVARCEDLSRLPVFTPAELTHVVPRAEVATPRASLLAGFWQEGSKDPEAKTSPRLPAMPRPIYLKPPNITLPKPKTRKKTRA